MTTNTLPRFSSSHAGMNCYGTNHRDCATKGTCGRCGRDVVKTDKGRILDIRIRVNANDRVVEDFACWQPAHVCDTIIAARFQAEHDAKIAAGEIIVTQHVIVTAGRKIPKGTQGIVRYVDMDNAYGPRVGIKVEGSEGLQYTAMKNVTATNVATIPGTDVTIAAANTIAAPATQPVDTEPKPVRKAAAPRTTGSHANCSHEATKAGRAACRRARANA